MKPQPIGAAVAALALLVSLLWGGNVAALKLGLDTFPAYWSAFWRFLAGMLAVLWWAKAKGVRLWPAPSEWAPLCALTAVFAVQISCLNLGAGWTSAAYAVVLLNAHPVFTNLFGQFVASEEKLNFRRVVGLALAFGGICWLAFGRPEARLAPYPIPGNVLITASAAMLASRALYTRRLVQSMHPLKPVVWQMALALPVFLAAAVALEPPTLKPVSWQAVAAILYQGPVVAGVCFVVWTTLLKKHSASALSIFAFTVPIFGVLLSAWMFDERIGGRLPAGAALVVVGILILTRARKASADALAPAPVSEAEGPPR